METLVFTILFLITVGSACIVAFSRNLIYSAFALIGTFLGIAGTFIFLHADFMGLVQIIVYAGGILVLIIFAVMLSTRLDRDTKTNPAINYKFVLPVVGLLVVLLGIVVNSDKWVVAENKTLAETSSITSLGNILLTEYLLPFELISVLLLLTMVGAAIITRRMVK